MYSKKYIWNSTVLTGLVWYKNYEQDKYIKIYKYENTIGGIYSSKKSNSVVQMFKVISVSFSSSSSPLGLFINLSNNSRSLSVDTRYVQY